MNKNNLVVVISIRKLFGGKVRKASHLYSLLWVSFLDHSLEIALCKELFLKIITNCV